MSHHKSLFFMRLPVFNVLNVLILKLDNMNAFALSSCERGDFYVR